MIPKNKSAREEKLLMWKISSALEFVIWELRGWFCLGGGELRRLSVGKRRSQERCVELREDSNPATLELAGLRTV